MPEYQLVVTVPPGQARAYSLTKPLITLGRSSDSDIIIDDRAVSRVHARIRLEKNRLEIEDLGSSNGVWIKGKSIKRAHFQMGQTVTIGNSTLRLRETVSIKETNPRTVRELSETLSKSSLDFELPDLSQPRLVINTATRTWEYILRAEATTLGRQSDCDIVLDDPAASLEHARLVRRKDGFELIDLGSESGTFIQGKRIETSSLQTGSSFTIGSTTLIFNSMLDDKMLETLIGSTLSKGGGRSPIVFVPGFMGSELWRGSERIWPNVTAMFTNPEMYRWPSREVIEPRQIVSEIVILPKFLKLERYAALGDFLCEDLGYERGKDLLEFPWDWRLNLRFAAQRLGERIAQWREQSQEAREPITLIAHSIGCLVARYYVEKLNGKAAVNRIVFMGGTHSGLPKALQPFSAFGKQSFLYGLAEPFERAIASLPSIYTMLPTYPSVFDSKGNAIDLYRDESWCPEEHRASLRDARAFRAELGTQSSVPAICVFGYGIQTPTRAVLDERTASGRWERIRFDAENKGDNTVPEESARLPNTEIHPVRQHHGTLYADNDVKMRLRLELRRR